VNSDIVEYDPFLNDLIFLFQSTRSASKDPHEIGKYMVFNNIKFILKFTDSRLTTSNRRKHLHNLLFVTFGQDRMLLRYKEFHKQLTSSNAHDSMGKTVIVVDFNWSVNNNAKHLQQSCIFLGLSPYSNR
jgi:hypothetical protein